MLLRINEANRISNVFAVDFLFLYKNMKCNVCACIRQKHEFDDEFDLRCDEERLIVDDDDNVCFILCSQLIVYFC